MKQKLGGLLEFGVAGGVGGVWEFYLNHAVVSLVLFFSPSVVRITGGVEL